MFHDGQQLDVGVAHPHHVFDQLHRHLAVSQRLALRIAHPRFGVNFVDGNRRFQPVGFRPLLQPRGIVPVVVIDVPDHRRRFRRHFALECIGVSFELLMAGEARSHVVLVRGPLAQAWNKQLPEAAVAAPHGVAANVPIVELAGHGHVFRVRRPHREAHAANLIGFRQVRAQRAVGFVQRAFAVQVDLGIGDQLAEAIGVFDLDVAPVPQVRAQSVPLRIARHLGAEEAVGVPLFHRPDLAVGQHLGGLGLRQKRAHFPARLPDFSANAMGAEDPEGIPVIPAHDRFNLCRGHES